MDIFNKIGKSISDGGRSAVQKTRDMTEIAKRSSSISDAQKQIQAYYQKLGATYYQRCISTGTGLDDPDVQRIQSLQKRIETWQAEIVQLRGYMNCPACGGEVSVSAPFCQHCGTALHPAEKQASVFCPNCGAAAAPGTRFCTSCGKPMELPRDVQTPQPEAPVAVEESPEPEPETETEPETEAEPSEEAVCPACGAKIRPGDVFCQTCGTRMS